jgi:hypothetical protein
VCLLLQVPNVSVTFLMEKYISVPSFKTRSRTDRTDNLKILTEDVSSYCKNQIQ